MNDGSAETPGLVEQVSFADFGMIQPVDVWDGKKTGGFVKGDAGGHDVMHFLTGSE